MKLQSRLRKLEDARPKCKPGVYRLATEGQEPSEVNRCPRCGGSHVLYIEEVVIESREEAERYLAMNDALRRSNP